MNLPPPPTSSFASDNTAGVAPAVMDALANANTAAAGAYGDERWTSRARDDFRDLFDAPVEVLWCWGGTGANVVALASLLQPWQAVICPDSAHIVVDECGAPARFTGATVVPVPPDQGKLRPEAIEAYVGWQGSEHHPQPAAISISQVTESGTVYTVEEIAELCSVAHRHGLKVHVDGARIANAVVAAGSGVIPMLRETGVDVLVFGATKNGTYGEAVVYLDPTLAQNAQYIRKQAGQLPSKSRFVAAQFSALLADDLWLRHARQANAMAQLLAASTGSIPWVTIPRPPQANSVFAQVPSDAIASLQDWSFFWDWDLSQSLVRWMTSFVTTEQDVERFAAGIAQLLAARSGADA